MHQVLTADVWLVTKIEKSDRACNRRVEMSFRLRNDSGLLLDLPASKEVADLFETGKNYLLTLEEED